MFVSLHASFLLLPLSNLAINKMKYEYYMKLYSTNCLYSVSQKVRTTPPNSFIFDFLEECFKLKLMNYLISNKNYRCGANFLVHLVLKINNNCRSVSAHHLGILVILRVIFSLFVEFFSKMHDKGAGSCRLTLK